MKDALRRYPAGVLERVQEADLTMLLAFDAICRELGLTYFLDGGSCLGAVRHGGFIPWDDDVDVAMPIGDYERFVEEAPRLLPETMELATPRTTPNYGYLWAKIYLKGTRFQDEATLEAGLLQRIFIDVFPYVPLGRDLLAARRALDCAQRWQKTSYLYHMSDTNVAPEASLRAPKALACRLAHALISRTTTPEKILERFEATFPEGVDDAIWGNPTATRPFPYPASVLFDPIELDFEGHRLFAPHDPEAYLAQLYGDWQTLPPEEKRHTHTPVVLDFGDGVNAMDTTSVAGW